MYRGDADRNKSLFKACCDEWKKVFSSTENGAVAGVSEEYRKYAIWMCENMPKLFKETKKEYGDCVAKYTFNFIKKP